MRWTGPMALFNQRRAAQGGPLDKNCRLYHIRHNFPVAFKHLFSIPECFIFII
jgi:hypothetical protein